MTRETTLISTTIDTVDNMIHQNIDTSDVTSENQTTFICDAFISIIVLLGNRLKDLRQNKLSKMKALEQFNQRGSQEGKQDWRNSKFVYVISAMQTYVYFN